MIKNIRSEKRTSRHIGRAPALLGCLLLAGLLAACSSVKTHVDKGPVKARTFSFVNPGSKQLPTFADQREQIHVMVQQAIINNLAKKGVSYTAAGGDITVAYLIIAGNNTTTTSLNDYFGYTEDSAALLEKVHSQQAVSDSSRGYFEAGTLVIDFVEPGTSKLLQRRSIHAQVLRNLTPETRTARVQAIVDQTLNDVPLAR